MDKKPTLIPAEYLTGDHDFGFTAAEAITFDDHKQAIKVAVHDQTQEILKLQDGIRDLEKIIVPLLLRFIKTSGTPMINWPNRKDICQKYLNQVLAITRPQA